MRLFPAERIVLFIIAAFVIADAYMIGARGVAIDWAGYASFVLIGIGLLGVGLTYRYTGRSGEIALATIAAGLYIVFTLVASVFNYLLLPVGELRLDPYLAQLDAYLGYSWPNFVEAVAQHPAVGLVLRYVYLSSLMQLLVVLILLGFTGRRAQLHEFLLVGLVGAIMTIGIWSFAPTIGPSAFYEIPAETQARLGMVVSSEYGATLRMLAEHGPTYITPKEVLGLIAFPSFHTVMALMSIFYMWPIRPLRIVFLVINMLMLPAILAHGGHYLVDLFGGAAVFFAAVLVTRQLLGYVSPKGIASAAA